MTVMSGRLYRIEALKSLARQEVDPVSADKYLEAEKLVSTCS